MPYFQGLLFAETLGGKLIDGVGQSTGIILGYSIVASRFVAAGVDLDAIVSIAVGGVGILVRGARAGARVVIVIVVVITRDLNDSIAAWLTLTGTAANKATEDASSGIKDVANDVSIAVARGIKQAIGGHLNLLHHLALIHHLSIVGLLGLLLEGY